MRQRVEIFQKLEQNSSWGEKCLFLEDAVMGPFYSSGMPFTIVPWTSTKSLLGERSAFSWKMQWWDLFIPAECHLLLFRGHPPNLFLGREVPFPGRRSDGTFLFQWNAIYYCDGTFLFQRNAIYYCSLDIHQNCRFCTYAQTVKNLPVTREAQVRSLDLDEW